MSALAFYNIWSNLYRTPLTIREDFNDHTIVSLRQNNETLVIVGGPNDLDQVTTLIRESSNLLDSML